MHCQRDSFEGVRLIVIIINIKGESQVKRIIAMVVALIGVAILVMGIVFEFQSSSGKKTVADEIAPVALSNLDAKYDAVKAAQEAKMAAEEPNIQAGLAAPSVTYSYLSAQRALLGMAKSNINLSKFVMMTGTVDIVLGLGLILAGTALYIKQTE
jgi:cytochrome c biogenesis factor